MSLTQEQTEIAHSTKSTMAVANPGVGKSFALAESVVHHISRGKDPSKIKIFSFSRTATSEIREKIQKKVGPEAYKKLQISTIHSFAYKIIAENLNQFGLKQLEIKDDYFFTKLVQRFAHQEDEEMNLDTASEVWSDIQTMKANNEEDSVLAPVAKHYSRAIAQWSKSNGVFSFLDLLYVGLRYLKKYPSVTQVYRDEIQLLFLDEAQDTARIQIDFLDYILDQSTQIVCLGDIKQTLYRFNNADPFYLLEWGKKRSMDLKSLNLTFRYGSSVSDLSWKVVERMALPSEHKQKTDTLESNESSVYKIVTETPEEYVMKVVDSIQNKLKNGVNPEECNILYRYNKHSLKFQTELVKRKIPFFVSGNSFLERIEVKFTLEWVKAVNTFDYVGFCYVLDKMNLGIESKILAMILKSFHEKNDREPNTVQELIDYAIQNHIKSVGDKRTSSLRILSNYLKEVKDITDNAGNDVFTKIAEAVKMRDLPFMLGATQEGEAVAEERIGFLAELDKIRCENEADSFMDFINFMKLEFAGDHEKDKKGKVYLGTYHSAKGCTMPYTYIILEDTLGTGKSRASTDDEMLDEYFVIFVGITRAKKELYCVAPLSAASNPKMNFLFDDIDVKEQEAAVPLTEERWMKRTTAAYKPLMANYEKLRETEKAVQLKNLDNGMEKWYPKSALATDGKKLFVAKWLKS